MPHRKGKTCTRPVLLLEQESLKIRLDLLLQGLQYKGLHLSSMLMEVFYDTLECDSWFKNMLWRTIIGSFHLNAYKK